MGRLAILYGQCDRGLLLRLWLGAPRLLDEVNSVAFPNFQARRIGTFQLSSLRFTMAIVSLSHHHNFENA
jgi:hypothetical protein